MISKLSKSTSTKEFIYYALNDCRKRTLKLLDELDDITFCNQYHPDFSPIGWHLGHIAYTESLWLLEHSAGLRCLFPQYRKLFAADGLPKSERVKLPNLAEIRYYLQTVREKVLQYLEVVDIKPQERLWRFLIQHESQHCEILSYVLELSKRGKGVGVHTSTALSNPTSTALSKQGCEGVGVQGNNITLSTQHSHFDSAQCTALSTHTSTPLSVQHSALNTQMVMIPAGEFEMGNNSLDALDNESFCHRVYLDTYWIDRYPVTCGQYREFMAAGGYKNPEWWSDAGWQWLQVEQVTEPLYWQNDRSYDDHPVCGVSWYEAEAYSRFVGKRLPTEAEWEKAASWDAQAQRRRTYPWGEEMPSQKYCNCDRLIGQTTPVGNYPGGESPYGLLDTLGNVWEWTASWFTPYQGFQSYPYVGYSQVYFDHQHRVLKGGSWATRPWVARCSFRNWYYPCVRQVFTGFRCATSVN
ncbi:ergothioneine biosynthesis protein EgtB [Nostoc sp. FACHB-87]|uniref:ergothioneine biosynthesis protein EgtB n=1 Tax=Nostocaceae TaxID=1162 RepID=UPI001685649F|nr:MULTISPECIES: SUMF1/EgtB/PvdO family nonheme iron enzyme [Nostocaceae]MBD2455198.1 ergothioneine biosynthesis protein EgtB [Nostoc sp. FACHB-87]MBD2474276.1 ergothioneine biosynthesis protein EgtB [Anabaena sp. FACHB-83]